MVYCCSKRTILALLYHFGGNWMNIFRPVFLSFMLLGGGFAITPPDSGYDRPILDSSIWERIPGDLVWNFGNMYQPCVRQIEDKEYPWRMWFFGWAHEDCNPGVPGCDSIYLARSRDLKAWEIYSGENRWDAEMQPEKWAPVLAADDKEYGSWHVGDPSVVIRNGKYFMAYSSTSKPGFRAMKNHNDGMILCVMGATSEDGIHWTRTQQPLLIEADNMLHAATEEGYTGDFHRPSLMWDEGKWRLWFDYWHPTRGVCMGYAENLGEFTDLEGFRILNAGQDALIYNWPNPEVIRANGKYYSYADPNGYPPRVGDKNAGWTSRALCEAESEDGIHWKINGFITPDTDSAACHVPQATLIEQDGKPFIYLFYATQRGGDPVFDYRYSRIRMMRRPVISR